MALTTGTLLGPYEILDAIGAGGMGEVYRARDTRLDRIVAIKTINGAFGDRFEREARAISALNHPHICALYDVGASPTQFLVMEFIEGTPLSGPVPIEQALRFGVQICDALDAAHRAGIVHRDLKPANIMIVKGGSRSAPASLKLLDFGLAKLASPALTPAAIDTEAAVTKALTGAHTILGTPQYMAPEQIEGHEADVRTDIFAFGCVLYELLTGRKAFDGKTSSSTMAAILATEPRPMRELQPVTPAALERVVKRCLAKDPEQRWQSARDLKAELEWIAEGGAQDATVSPSTPARPTKTGIVWKVVAGVLAVVTGLAFWAPWRQPPPAEPGVALNIYPGEGEIFFDPAFSPDGRQIALRVRANNSVVALAVRHLDSLEVRKLTGTEGASSVTWSPDGQSLAFVTALGKLKRVDIAGGPPQTICDTPPSYIPFTAWSKEGVILFSSREGLKSVSDRGGAPTLVTTVDASHMEYLHGVPQFLPDGRHFIYFARNNVPDQSGVYVGTLDGPIDFAHRQLVWRGPRAAVYAQEQDGNDYLLFEREGALMAQPLDLASLQLRGSPFLVAPQIARANDMIPLSASMGALVFAADSSAAGARQLAWFDRSGKHLSDVGAPGTFFELSLSPDDKRIAVARNDEAGDIWIAGASATGTFRRFTSNPTADRYPQWSEDGSRIVFRSSSDEGQGVYEKAAGGVAPERLLMNLGSTVITISDWSLDGHHLVYLAAGDIWVATDGKPAAAPFLKTEFVETQAQLSPDAKWMAYVSDKAKQNDVYVQRFPTSGEEWLVSTAGGSHPRWRRDGSELFYLAPDGKLMVASLKKGAGFEADVPGALFPTQLPYAAGFHYAVSADGQRFLIGSPVQNGPARPLTVLTNWLAGVRK